MANPILTMLNRKTTNEMAQRVNTIKGMIGNNPKGLFDSLYATNPNFRQFIDCNKGKSPEDIANEYGIDLQTIMELFR